MVSLIVSEHGRHLVEEGGRGLVVDVVVGWLLQGLGQWPTLSKENSFNRSKLKVQLSGLFQKIVFIPFLTLYLFPFISSKRCEEFF